MKIIHSFEAARPFIKDGTLVLLDIDDTLIRSGVYLGSQRFCETMVCREMFNSDDDFLQYHIKFRKYKNSILESHLGHQLVETNLIAMLNDWKTKGAIFIGITARSVDRAEETEETLKRFGLIDFFLKATDFSFCLESHVLFENGVIYSDEYNTKCSSFLRVASMIKERHPEVEFSSICYFDDSLNHLEIFNRQANQVALLSAISGVVLPSNLNRINLFHYQGTKEFYEGYDHTVAKIQFVHFISSHVMLSNEEAKRILGSHGEKEKRDLERTFEVQIELAVTSFNR